MNVTEDFPQTTTTSTTTSTIGGGWLSVNGNGKLVIKAGDSPTTGWVTSGHWYTKGTIMTGEPMRYLYKAYVIYPATEGMSDDIIEVKPFIAKDEVSAKVKAILSAKADPDTAHVILQRLGEVPKRDDCRNE